jgi:hypothetical protein
MLGLSFEPDRSDHTEYDIRGTLWIPMGSGETAHIDFRHTRYPYEDELFEWVTRAGRGIGMIDANLGDRVGGRIDLAFVPEFGWVVEGYVMRWPHIRRSSFALDHPEIRRRIRNGQDPSREQRAAFRQSAPPWQIIVFEELEVRLLRLQVSRPGELTN